MDLQTIRKSRNLSQRELSQMSGINYRSLQDYEQGHKKLSSAGGDILLRLSTVLGCSVEELLLSDSFHGAPLVKSDRLPVGVIQGQRFFCKKYRVSGRWVCNSTEVATLFYYAGEALLLPFHAIFTEDNLEWLAEAAVLQMEAAIEALCWEQQGVISP